eukprot:scaffold51747_cov19-Tisochrysis_lutea.AAC.3
MQCCWAQEGILASACAAYHTSVQRLEHEVNFKKRQATVIKRHKMAHDVQGPFAHKRHATHRASSALEAKTNMLQEHLSLQIKSRQCVTSSSGPILAGRGVAIVRGFLRLILKTLDAPGPKDIQAFLRYGQIKIRMSRKLPGECL